MQSFNVVLLVTVGLLINVANCGVINNVYERVSNTTKAVKDDVSSWWSYGVDTIIGSDDDNQCVRSIQDNTMNAVNQTKVEVEKQSGMISGIYNRFKGGVSYGYMKVHDVVLGKDSDPNKGIIRTLYERAMHRLSQLKSFVFGDDNALDHTESEEKGNFEREEVLKVLFGNKTDLFSDENEKRALDSLRNKLTEAGDNTLHLADNEREIIKKAYESIRQKANEFKTSVDESVDTIKNKAQDNIEKTQEFIQDASKNVDQGTQNLAEKAKQSVNDMTEKVNRD